VPAAVERTRVGKISAEEAGVDDHRELERVDEADALVEQEQGCQRSEAVEDPALEELEDQHHDRAGAEVWGEDVGETGLLDWFDVALGRRPVAGRQGGHLGSRLARAQITGIPELASRAQGLPGTTLSRR